jgi:hypothetical protein
LIVLNSSGGAASRSTAMLIQKEILKAVEEEIVKKQQKLRELRLQGLTYADDEDEASKPYTAEVMIVNDELANIFKNSQRSRTMFPDLQPQAAAAVSLARFAQEPLGEYCSAWQSANSQEIFGYELLFLNIHPLKVFSFFSLFCFMLFSRDISVAKKLWLILLTAK